MATTHYKEVGALCIKELGRIPSFYFDATCEICIVSCGNCKRKEGECERSSK